MKNIVPNFNKTQLKRALEVSPPGSYHGFIDWKNIVVKTPRGDCDSTGWKEAYIPFNLLADSYTTMKEIDSVFDSIERIWGRITFDGTKGLSKHKGKICIYVCLQPGMSGKVRR